MSTSINKLNADIKAAIAEAEPFQQRAKALATEAMTIRQKPLPEIGKATAQQLKEAEDDAARLSAIGTELQAIAGNLAPAQERLEDCKRQKAAIVNAYGVKIRAIRATKKMGDKAFVAWRNEILAMPDQDARLVAIDAKLAEVGG